MQSAPDELSETPGAHTSSDSRQVFGAIPDVRLATEAPNARRLTRSGLIAEKQMCAVAQQDAFHQLRRHPAGSDGKYEAHRRIQACAAEREHLEDILTCKLLPQHGPTQLLGPRTFLQTPLFRVAGKQCPRAAATTVLLLDQPHVIYRGPELRQSDGLVFSTLLHMARDVLLGTAVSFHPSDVCRTILGRYDGNARRQLKDHIQRLQSGVVAFESFSIQLCQRFDYPARGRWSVALDRNILSLFRNNHHVWLDVDTRLKLPEGLASWLYGFVRSQSKLIPMRLETLRARCGSDASDKAFMNGMRTALRELAAHDVVDAGWSLGEGVVHWRKGAYG